MSAVEEYIEEAAGWDVVSTKYADAALAEVEAERDAATNAMDNLARKLTESEEERDKWADSFKQAEAALEGYLGQGVEE